MKDLFNSTDSGAIFSEDRKYRYALWRIWNRSKPIVMFIGLNPSTANEDTPDPTIRSVTRLSKNNGYGGFYMMNCFPFVSTDPSNLHFIDRKGINDSNLKDISKICKDVVFAWGNFKIVIDTGRQLELEIMFKKALCIGKNKNGSPKHPLYAKATTKLIPYL